jgi:dimethylhistidine N-methyltransferase
MPSGYRVLDSEPSALLARELAVDVLVGLSERPKRLPSRLFYDAVGSELFAKICDQPEYYLTRAEHEILTAHAEELVAALGDEPCNLVDLGAGDGRKTFVILDALVAAGLDVRYVPMDISESALAGLVETTRARYGDALKIEGLVSEYVAGIDWLSGEGHRRSLVLFLGSNIGNFDRAQATRFLRRLWSALDHGDLALIGFDLKKGIDTLLHAYNDSAGLTARFNLNLLTRINAELGGQFDPETFRHFATYNVLSGAMESYLLSLERQTVRVEALQRSFSFRAYEPIHTEYSFKYLDEDVLSLADETGFDIEARYWDRERRFCDALWRVRKHG